MKTLQTHLFQVSVWLLNAPTTTGLASFSEPVFQIQKWNSHQDYSGPEGLLLVPHPQQCSAILPWILSVVSSLALGNAVAAAGRAGLGSRRASSCCRLQRAERSPADGLNLPCRKSPGTQRAGRPHAARAGVLDVRQNKASKQATITQLIIHNTFLFGSSTSAIFFHCEMQELF